MTKTEVLEALEKLRSDAERAFNEVTKNLELAKQECAKLERQRQDCTGCNTLPCAKHTFKAVAQKEYEELETITVAYRAMSAYPGEALDGNSPKRELDTKDSVLKELWNWSVNASAALEHAQSLYIQHSCDHCRNGTHCNTGKKREKEVESAFARALATWTAASALKGYGKHNVLAGRLWTRHARLVTDAVATGKPLDDNYY